MKAEFSSHSNYTEQTFTGLDLDRVQLTDCEFYDCTFVRCSFVESVLYHNRFIGCCFKQCDLSMVQVPSSFFLRRNSKNPKSLASIGLKQIGLRPGWGFR
ncbi:MAG: pentapeptide repeat-containing protein [Anaerolineales bacterium]|nr:pentapeptide repeat-containing protein [Anaerolineales bacterium]